MPSSERHRCRRMVDGWPINPTSRVDSKSTYDRFPTWSPADTKCRPTVVMRRRGELPLDSTARIQTSGVLGDQFIALEAGGDEDMLSSGDEIEFTESALSLERLVGKFVNDAGLEDD